MILTDCGGLLQAAVKDFDRADPSFSPIFFFIFNTHSLSTFLFLSLNPPLVNLYFSLISSRFHSTFTQNPSSLLNHSLFSTNSTSFHHFFFNFISSSSIFDNHLLPSLILLIFHLNSSFFFLKFYLLGFSFNSSSILQTWHSPRDKGVSRRQEHLAKHHSGLNGPPELPPTHKLKVTFLILLI